jgi:hypothetical protein
MLHRVPTSAATGLLAARCGWINNATKRAEGPLKGELPALKGFTRIVNALLFP